MNLELLSVDLPYIYRFMFQVSINSNFLYIPPSFLTFHIPLELFNENTLYSSNKELETVFKYLDFNVLSWFNIKSKFRQVSINGSRNSKNKIESTTKVILLGIKIGKKLKFKSHIEGLCKRTCF